MFILDSLLIGGLRFVFDKIAAAVDKSPTAVRQIAHRARQRAGRPGFGTGQTQAAAGKVAGEVSGHALEEKVGVVLVSE